MSSINKRLLIDSSSLILLHKCGVIPGLLDFCIPVIPETVFAELTVKGHDGADLFRQLCMEGKIVISIPGKNKVLNLSRSLGKGETDVILLYHEGQGDYIIIDDGKGGSYCRNNGIPYINALLAVKIIFMKKLITEDVFSCAWNWLVKYGRYSKDIVIRAENAAGELIERFMPD